MQHVLLLLETRDSVHVAELAETFSVSEVTVRSDLSALAEQGGFTRAELAQLARNGWKVADVPESERRRWLAEIDRIAGA